MTLSHFALEAKHTIWALSIGVLIFGSLAYLGLPIQLFPETAPPLVNVLTSYPGAAALDVADLVSEPIEEECAALEGVYKVSSTSQDGLSLVSVEFNYNVSVDLAAVDVQNAISRVRAQLPREIGEPQVLKFSTSDRPVLTVGLVGEDLVATRRLADDVLAPEVQRIDGVALVDVFGGHLPEITVAVDRDRLDAHKLTLGALVKAIREHNVSLPAGQIRSGGQQLTFRVDERSRTLAELAQIPVATATGTRIVVGDLADVVDGRGEDFSRYRVDGETAIAIQVFKQDDANTVEVVERARRTVEDFRAQYPEIRFLEAEESASFTQQVVRNMLGSVLQALLLASVVIFLFLGSVKRGLVVVVSMPMSFLLTFAGMKLFDLQLDLVTLTAIILAVGMVVDASVVVLENITRRYQEGSLSPDEAAKAGASEIQFAVIAGTATTLTVLVPLLFLYGFVGKTFGPLAGTMIIAFLSSLLVALTLVPILTALVSRGDGTLERFAQRIAAPWNWSMERLRDSYLWILRRSLNSRASVFGVAAALFVAGLLLMRLGGMELLPRMDSGASFVTVETVAGSSIDETERVLRDVEKVIRAESEVRHVSTQIGFEPGMHSFGGGGVQGPTQGYISLTLSPRTERKESIWQIQDRIRDNLERIPGIQTFVVRESGNTSKATTAASIVVSVRGPDPRILDKLGDDILDRIRNVEGVTNPYREWRIDQQSTVLTVDVERAREIGVPPALVAAELVRSLDGETATHLRDELGSDTPIRVRYARSYRKDEQDALAVRTVAVGDGNVVPLRAVAQQHQERVQGLVARENLEPALDVLALHQDRPLSFVAADVAEAVSEVAVPRGYAITLEGENKDMSESRDELVGALLISIAAIYLLLVAQFKSFVYPVTVLMSVPLSLIGVSVALWIAGKPVSMPVMIGLILLVGIVVNNAIILIDFIRQKRLEGMERREAIVDSVRVRFRPIMMTSLSTIVGMIPLAMEWALGAERFSPLAIAVIGGMTASTFLTMIAIPVLYDVFDDLRMRLRRLGPASA